MAFNLTFSSNLITFALGVCNVCQVGGNTEFYWMMKRKKRINIYKLSVLFFLCLFNAFSSLCWILLQGFTCSYFYCELLLSFVAVRGSLTQLFLSYIQTRPREPLYKYKLTHVLSLLLNSLTEVIMCTGGTYSPWHFFRLYKRLTLTKKRECSLEEM